MPNKKRNSVHAQDILDPASQGSDTARILSLIKNCRDYGRTWLHLDRSNLTSIPQDVLGLEKLQTLDISGNKIESIPASIWDRLPNLKKLTVAGNPIESLPDRPGLVVDIDIYLNVFNEINPANLEIIISNTTTLAKVEEFLDCYAKNRGILSLSLGSRVMVINGKRHDISPGIRKILESITVFKGLESLIIRGLKLGTVPPTIRELKSLTTLRLDGGELTELPEWIVELPLEHFTAVANKLTKLPASAFKLKHLKILNLAWNKDLKTVPNCIFKLANLDTLILRHSGISHIPIDILNLTKLKTLSIENTSIEDPPPEVAKNGLGAIRDYWRQRVDAGVNYLCEAKLIILGEPGAGKTSLAHKMVDRNYILSESQRSTEGIDVLNYQFPTSIRTNLQKNSALLDTKFQVNIWDFGGQEIYHATHQFFLTRRSVYVLVCDNRKEDTDFSYWLNVVEMLSGNSPLLIVQNEKQDRTREINVNTLRGQFENLKGSFRTNLDTNRGLDTIIHAIEHELRCLPHIGAGLPATWKRVREVLEEDKREHISLEEYLVICQKHGFTHLKDKLQLSEYLHDLGIFLHFQDDPVLKNIVILKPSWGTDAVYRVLDDSSVIASHGRFSTRELGRIWSEGKYEGVQHELLKLMTKFQLCYTLKEGAYIAPQLLSPEQPQYPWQQAGGIVVRYSYKFLPKGIITRLIVSMHHLIDDGLVWKTGVVLARDQSKVEIIEDYTQRTIKVRAIGPNRHGLFTIVDEQLERLHRTFHRLQFEKYLPCQCAECSAKADPYGFPLENLTKMANKGSLIQCYESGIMIDAGKLIQEIFPDMYKPLDIQAEAEIMTLEKIEATDKINEVFVSYAWNEESQTIADILQKSLENQGIRLIRDRDDLNYRDSIRTFMQRLGKGKCVVAIISEDYLKSDSCMFELLEISKAQQLRERIFPIVLADANIYKPLGRVSYVKHWEDEIQSLDTALKSLRGEDLSNLQQELNFYAEIRRSFDSISNTLRDMNALTPAMHKGSKFEQVIAGIKAQMKA